MQYFSCDWIKQCKKPSFCSRYITIGPLSVDGVHLQLGRWYHALSFTQSIEKQSAFHWTFNENFIIVIANIAWEGMECTCW